MTLGNICWYLSVLFLITLVPLSAMTVVPAGETERHVEVVVAAICAVLFGLLGVALKWRGISGPKWLLRVFQGVAAVTTLLLLLLLGG